jgi:hypothetical protein
MSEWPSLTGDTTQEAPVLEVRRGLLSCDELEWTEQHLHGSELVLSQGLGWVGLTAGGDDGKGLQPGHGATRPFISKAR